MFHVLLDWHLPKILGAIWNQLLIAAEISISKQSGKRKRRKSCQMKVETVSKTLKQDF